MAGMAPLGSANDKHQISLELCCVSSMESEYKYLTDVLPPSFRHNIESINGTEDDFTAVIRANCTSAEECHQWLQEFQVTLRDCRIAYSNSPKCINAI